MRRLIVVLALAAAVGGPGAFAQSATPDTENGLLKKDMLARNLPLPGGMASAPSAEQQRELNLKLPLPSDAEIDRVMSAFEKMWRRLVDMVQKTPNSDKI